jgi:YVTN family beta-propeller protein
MYKPFMTRLYCLIISCLLFCLHTLAQQASPTYQFEKKINLPGDGKWDYLKMDGERERLFVSHGDRVHVIDLKTDQPVGEITSLSGVHGIGLAKDLNKGYITNGVTNAITVFDYDNFKVLQTLMVPGKKADAVLYDKFSQQIFVFNNGSGNAVVINARTDKVVGTVEMGGAPEFACTNDKGSIFNNNEETNEVIEIDAKTRTIKHRFSLAPGEVATGLTIDPATNRLFSVCRKTKTLVVLDATSGKIIQTLSIGGGVDGVVFDKELKRVMTSNGEGNVTVVQQDSPDQYRVIQTLMTKPGQKTIVHRGTTHRLYLSGADYKEGTRDIVPGTFGVSVYGLSAKQ